MSKKFKISSWLVLFTFAILFLLATKVSATEVFIPSINNGINIASINDLEDYLEDESITGITVENNTITLNNLVSLSDNTLKFTSGEYCLNLKGNQLDASNLNNNCLVIDGATLTIQDSVGTGKISGGITVETNGTLNITGGKFENSIYNEGMLNITGGRFGIDICNEGTAIIDDGIFEATVWNGGTLTIKDGTFACVNQSGTATIEGGTFTVTNGEALYIALTSRATTTLTGGTFTTSDTSYGGITIQTMPMGNEDDILSIIGTGYKAEYDYYYFENDIDTYFSKYKTIVTIVEDIEEYTGEFRKISTDGTWKINSFKPKNAEDAEFLLTAVANDYIDTSKYEAFAGCADGENSDVTIINVFLRNKDNGENQSHVLTVTYNEPNTNTTNKVNEVLSKMKQYNGHGDMTIKTAYMLDDLYLINYLYTNSKGFDEVAGNGKALNFAKDLINATNGGNISYKFDPRAGEWTPTGLFDFAMGQVVVYYNGTAYTSTNAAITANHVIYIPNTTPKTTDAYEKAVLKRIKDYLGTSGEISVELGGTLESLNYEEEEYKQDENGYWNPTGRRGNVSYNKDGLIDTTKSDGNYYNITIEGNTYRFAVLAEEESKLETPKYVGCDILSNISVSSDVTTIPLDTSVTVNKVSNKEIEEAIGNQVYAAYDISLYSNFKKASIKKLDNGKFIVSIPVPENLKDKELIVYYITSTGEKEEHIATVKDGIASFETDHFSTYILTENKKEKDETPKTGIINYIEIVSTICITALLGIAVLNKRK